MLKNNYVLKTDHEVEIHLKSPLEINLLSKIESELVVFLRNELSNDHLIVTHRLSMEKAKQKAYTSAEIFNEMSKKNPDLLKLKDALGLDTEF